MQQNANPVCWLRDGEPAVCIPRYGPLRRAQGESARAPASVHSCCMCLATLEGAYGLHMALTDYRYEV